MENHVLWAWRARGCAVKVSYGVQGLIFTTEFAEKDFKTSSFGVHIGGHPGRKPGSSLQGSILPSVEAIHGAWIPAPTLAPALFYYSTSCAYPCRNDRVVFFEGLLLFRQTLLKTPLPPWIPPKAVKLQLTNSCSISGRKKVSTFHNSLLSPKFVAIVSRHGRKSN